MNHIGTILTVSLTLYALAMCIFLISENRRPQATLAWTLVLIFAPGIGLLVYMFFGRDWKAFSK
jgi:cardiolipin synthase A/B